ncbi:histidine--tRNA ligase [Peptoniphilaceae bacterium SGI.137]|nr:histidine--tRNA ligase [Peptoniphilaceae bacterium]MDY4196470.1 histidine--tRNA ligase [Peptoniphilaceae bacterium]
MTQLVQPGILPGFMELLPEEQVLFNSIMDTIRRHFERYGFWPLDTPMIEKSEILFAKGGGETTKQIYRIVKGEHSQDQALRFDLTVPLARYVAQHASEISFPFRRYQIAKVFRGERNQKGRYREFYQADIDIIGRDSLSLLNDAEIPAVIYGIFQEIGVGSPILHINHRGLLNGFFHAIGLRDSEEALRSLDKLAKIGETGVKELLLHSGASDEQIRQIFDFLAPTNSNSETFALLENLEEGLALSEEAGNLYKKGLAELHTVFDSMLQFGIPETAIQVDRSITRGLDYYTGMVYETFLEGYESIGSVCSGGRYDNLAENFTKEHLPGVGLSIGLTRLFYQLHSTGLITPHHGDYIDAIIIPMGEEDFDFAIQTVRMLREQNLRVQIYTEKGKMKKKFAYADSIGAGSVITIGESERKQGKISLKNLETGVQEILSVEEAVKRLQRH